MFLKPAFTVVRGVRAGAHGYGYTMRILVGFHGGNDYLIVLRFDTPKHEKAYQDFHAWALDFFEGLYSALPQQSIAGVFIGTPEELKKEIEKELT